MANQEWTEADLMDPATFTALRKTLGYSKVALAERLGVTRYTITNYENATSPIPRMAAMAMVLLNQGGAVDPRTAD